MASGLNIGGSKKKSQVEKKFYISLHYCRPQLIIGGGGGSKLRLACVARIKVALHL